MEHLTYVLILTITTSLGAVSTQKEYANTYNNCVEHGMAWADTQRPLHPDDSTPILRRARALLRQTRHLFQTLIPIPRPKPHRTRGSWRGTGELLSGRCPLRRTRFRYLRLTRAVGSGD